VRVQIAPTVEVRIARRAIAGIVSDKDKDEEEPAEVENDTDGLAPEIRDGRTEANLPG